MDKKIDALRKVLNIGAAAFEIQHAVSMSFGYSGPKSYIHNLYLVAKEEINKEHPDLNKIDVLFAMIHDEFDIKKGG